MPMVARFSAAIGARRNRGSGPRSHQTGPPAGGVRFTGGHMTRTIRRLALALLLSTLAAGTAAAQTNLRIGLAEDPDVLDPSLARTYVGRIVFASMCDKLFDIDEHMNIVP